MTPGSAHIHHTKQLQKMKTSKLREKRRYMKYLEVLPLISSYSLNCTEIMD